MYNIQATKVSGNRRTFRTEEIEVLRMQQDSGLRGGGCLVEMAALGKVTYLEPILSSHDSARQAFVLPQTRKTSEIPTSYSVTSFLIHYLRYMTLADA